MATAPPSATWKSSFLNGFVAEDAGGCPLPWPWGSTAYPPPAGWVQRRLAGPALPAGALLPLAWPLAPGPAAQLSFSYASRAKALAARPHLCPFASRRLFGSVCTCPSSHADDTQ